MAQATEQSVCPVVPAEHRESCVLSAASSPETEDKKRHYLRQLRRTGRVAAAVQACGMGRNTPKRWNNEDAAFASAAMLQIRRHAQGDRPSGNALEDEKSDSLAYLVHFHDIPSALHFTGWGLLPHQQHLRDDPHYAARWQLALDGIYARLEMDLLRRALFGTQRPIVRGGAVVVTTCEYNDMAAMRLLAAHHKARSETRSEELATARLQAQEQAEMTMDDSVAQLRVRLIAIRERLERQKAAASAGDATGKSDILIAS